MIQRATYIYVFLLILSVLIYFIIVWSRKKKSIKIYDCFLFKDEFAMLDFHLTEVGEYVDYFVLVESAHTFKGDKKPMWFKEHGRKRLGKNPYFSKIRHIMVENEVDPNPWENEKYQRDQISRGLYDADDKDVIILVDVDEIPNRDILKELKKKNNNNSMRDDTIYTLPMDFYYYDIYHKQSSTWRFPKIMKFSATRSMDMNNIRGTYYDDYPNNPLGGWHLSYFMSPEEISRKINDFSHQEYNSKEYTDPELIRNKILGSRDLFGNADMIPVDPKEQSLPKYILDFFPDKIVN